MTGRIESYKDRWNIFGCVHFRKRQESQRCEEVDVDDYVRMCTESPYFIAGFTYAGMYEAEGRIKVQQPQYENVATSFIFLSNLWFLWLKCY